MPDASWPTALPAEPELGTYIEEIVSNLGAVTLGGGLPSSTRRSAVRHTRVSGSWLLSPAELGAFITFFTTTLFDGVKPFRWVNPSYDEEGRYLFDPDNQPKWEPIGVGSLYKVNISLLKLN